MNANSFRPSCITISPSPKVLRQFIIRALLRRATLFLTVLLLAGCSKRYSDLPSFFPFGLADYENQSVGRFKTSYIADQIDEFFRGTDPGPVGITTFVNLEDLHTTSPFGRLCGEQLMSELTMRGYDVIELRHSDAITFLNPDGEFSLSREAAAVRRSQRLGAILAGTYSASPERVYVNVRLIDPSSSRVLSAASVEMSRTKEISKLLRGGSIPLTLERVPVRNLSQIGNATVAPGSNIGQPIVIPRDGATQGAAIQSPLSSGATIRY